MLLPSISYLDIQWSERGHGIYIFINSLMWSRLLVKYETIGLEGWILMCLNLLDYTVTNESLTCHYTSKVLFIS